VSGLKGRGGFEVAMSWEGGSLENVTVTSLQGKKLHLRYQTTMISTETQKDMVYTFTGDQFKQIE
jgi:alpha-L-fucosidase 2